MTNNFYKFIRHFSITLIGIGLACGIAMAQSSNAPLTRSVNDKTDARLWSNFGWNRIKWGMGPGDIRSALGRDDYLFFNEEKGWIGKIQWHSLGVDKIDFNGSLGTFVFSFNEGRLMSFSLNVDCGDSIRSTDVCSQEYKKLSSHFDDVYGKAYCTIDVKQFEKCQWDQLGETWITSFYSNGSLISFTFSNPENKAFRYKFQTEDSKTAPREWGITAWSVFKLGMGYDDVVKLAVARSGAIQAKKNPLCYRKLNSAEIDCYIESVSHSFKILGQSPQIQFKFSGKRLIEISLLFKDDLPQFQSIEFAKKTKFLLAEKYGKPFDEFLGNAYMTSRWKGDGIEVRLLGGHDSVSVAYVDLNPKNMPLKRSGGGL